MAMQWFSLTMFAKNLVDFFDLTTHITIILKKVIEWATYLNNDEDIDNDAWNAKNISKITKDTISQFYNAAKHLDIKVNNFEKVPYVFHFSIELNENSTWQYFCVDIVCHFL